MVEYLKDSEYRNKIIIGDVMDNLILIPDKSIHMIVTSPPYWGLRDYNTGKWVGGDSNCDHKKVKRTTIKKSQDSSIIQPYSNTGHAQEGRYSGVCKKCGAIREDDQIGHEKTSEEYINKMVDIFREVRRVLRGDGTLWLNLGDSYAKGYSDGMKAKDMACIPFRVAIALRQDGWFLRSAMPWLKKGAMPESSMDRPTTTIEYMFLLTKSSDYFYDAEAVRLPNKESSIKRAEYMWNCDRPSAKAGENGTHVEQLGDRFVNPSGRLRRSSDWFFESWQGLYEKDDEPLALIVNPGGSKEAHFAQFPSLLVEPCIMAGTSQKGVCPECGTPWERIVEKRVADVTHPRRFSRDDSDRNDSDRNDGTDLYEETETNTIGWKPVCTCGREDVVPAIVADIFMGSGTVAAEAKRLGRDYFGTELNGEYINKIALKRIENTKYQFNLFD